MCYAQQYFCVHMDYGMETSGKSVIKYGMLDGAIPY